VQPFQAQPSALAPHGPLPSAESLHYAIEWRLITAGKAHLTWSSIQSGYQTNLQVHDRKPLSEPLVFLISAGRQ